MISRSLGIELPTVKNHVHSLLGKLGVHRRAEAVTLTQHWTASGSADLREPAHFAQEHEILARLHHGSANTTAWRGDRPSSSSALASSSRPSNAAAMS